VNDLITGSKFVLDDEPVAVAVADRLTRPLLVAVVGPASHESLAVVNALKTRDDMIVDHVTSVGHHVATESDLIVLLFGAGDPDPVAKVTELTAALKAADAGPYAVEALVVGTNPEACQGTVDAVLASPAGQTLVPGVTTATAGTISALAQFTANLADVRGIAFRATSGLRLLQLALKKTPSSAGRSELLDRIDALQQELPLLVELELLREIVSGRAALPRWLRAELSRLLIHPEPARRLGLAADADAVTLQEAIQATSTGWRVLENTGRIPFSARKAMLIAQQALDRLHAELAYYG
jgi:hypothetical protein